MTASREWMEPWIKSWKKWLKIKANPFEFLTHILQGNVSNLWKTQTFIIIIINFWVDTT